MTLQRNSNHIYEIMNREDEILRILYQHNPWWIQKPISTSKLKPFKRQDYYKILDRLKHKEILSLIGPRQVGKTTLLYQLIDNLLSREEPRKIFFLSLDDPYIPITIKTLARIFDIYSANILKEPLSDIKDRIHIFLDEIQVVENWEIILKRWYDLGYKIKFVVTGSSSTSIRDGSSEALVGRIHPQIVFPMKFLEYVRFNEPEIAEMVRSKSKSMREALKLALTNNDSGQFFSVAYEEFKALLPYKDRILVLLNEYFIKGGYPEIANTSNTVDAARYLANYLHLTIYKDILRTKKVRDPVALENLFAILSKGSSQIINRVNLAQNLGLKRDTMNTYIYLLKAAFLISEAEFFSDSRVKRARREKKIFVNDIGIRNMSASLFDEQTLANNTEMGRIVETVIGDHTLRLRFNLDAIPFPRLFYWKETYEVDFVINPFNKTLPIEVKYRENVEDSDLLSIKKFKQKFKPPLSLVITKEHLVRSDSTVLIPAWLYLMIC